MKWSEPITAPNRGIGRIGAGEGRFVHAAYDGVEMGIYLFDALQVSGDDFSTGHLS
jgi:hypothetical protein